MVMTFAEVRKELIRQCVLVNQAGFIVDFVVISKDLFEAVEPVFRDYIEEFGFRPLDNNSLILLDGKRLILCEESGIFKVVPDFEQYLETTRLISENND